VADKDHPARQDGGRRDTVRLVAILVLVALLIAFVVDNTRKVKVGFVFGDHETRLIFVLVVAVVLGALLDRLWIHSRNKH
jgi:uncharacterized integral membrane protein